MRTFALVSAFAAGAILATPAFAQTTPAKVQVGVLECSVSPAVSFVLGSKRELACEFKTGIVGSMTTVAAFTGSVDRFGIDLGFSGPGKLGWGVFAPTATVAATDLAGTYVGVSADAAWGVGGGANVLLGGSQKTIALQPISVQGVTGMQVAAGIADLTLVPVVPAGKVTK